VHSYVVFHIRRAPFQPIAQRPPTPPFYNNSFCHNTCKHQPECFKIKIHHFAHRHNIPAITRFRKTITLPLPLQASRHKFKIFLQETCNQVRPRPRSTKKNITIPPCDGGFSRCALLSLAMLWNQLNYITTVQVHDLIDLFRNALGLTALLWKDSFNYISWKGGWEGRERQDSTFQS
jgi:hypothetical protein